MIVFDLPFQTPDFFGVVEAAADGFSFLFRGIEGVGSVEDGVFPAFEFDLEELADDRSSTHLFDGGDKAEDLLADGPEFREAGHGNLLSCSIYTTL